MVDAESSNSQGYVYERKSQMRRMRIMYNASVKVSDVEIPSTKAMTEGQEKNQGC